MNCVCQLGLLALLLVPLPATAARSLAEALGDLTASQGVNFVLQGGPSLEMPVPDHVRSLPQMEQWLRQQGLEVDALANGDRVIRRPQRGQLALRALPVRATPLTPEATLADSVSRTTLDAELLDALGGRRLDPLFSRVANVFGSAGEYYVRGVPSRGELNTLGNAAARLGKAPLPDLLLGQLPLTTWDLESADFERGTRSGAFGGPFSAYAGGIALIPAAPGFDDSYALRLAADHRGGGQLAARLNKPLIDEELALRVSVDQQRVAGTLQGLDGRPFDDAESRTTRMALLWEPVSWPATRWTLDLSHVDGDAGPQRLIADQPGDRTGGSAPFAIQRLSAWTAVAGVSVETASGHHWQADAVATRGRSALDPTRPLSNTFDPPFRLVNGERSSLRSLQLDWRRPFQHWQLGASLSAGRSDSTEVLIRDQRDWRLDSALSRTSMALDAQWQLTPAWSLEGRLRYTRDRLYRDCLSVAPQAEDADCFEAIGLLLIPADGEFSAFRSGYDQWSPELVLNFHPVPGRRLFVRALRGFNAGGAVSSARFSGEPFWIFYQPEQARTAELGWQETRERWQLGLTAFHTSLRGQWNVVQGGAFIDDVSNSGYSGSNGLELETRLQLGERHRIDLSAGWLHTRYRQYTPFERDAQFEPVAGNDFAGAPPYSGSVTWRAQLSPRWRWNLAASYHGEVEANANNPEFARIPDVVLLDTQLAWQRGPVTVSARFDNLLDRQYQLTTPDVSRRTRRIDYLPGPPRTFTLTLELRF